MLLVWLFQYMKNVLRGMRFKTGHTVQLLILLGGAIGPWLALDLLMFDEFFIIPYFVFLGMTYLYDVGQEDETDGMTEEVTQ